MSDLHNQQPVIGVRLQSDGAKMHNNLPVIGIREQAGAEFVSNRIVLGVVSLDADEPIFNDQPVMGAVLIEDGRELYNNQLVIPVEIIGGVDPDPVPSNLLAGLDWEQGASTTLSVTAERARATMAGTNPRIFKHVTGLTIGAAYRLTGNVYIGTASQVFLRVALTSGISADGPYSQVWSADQFVDDTFVADAVEYYVGIVGVTAANGDYVEIDFDFEMIEQA